MYIVYAEVVVVARKNFSSFVEFYKRNERFMPPEEEEREREKIERC